MMNKRTANLAIAACFAIAATAPLARADMTPPATIGNGPSAELITNGPQASVGDNAASARRNVAESHQYEQLLKANPGFRQARINKECGPIDDPTLHESCVASFR